MDLVSEETKYKNIVRISVMVFVVFVVLAVVLGAFVSIQVGILLFIVAIIGGSVPVSLYQYMQYNKFTKMEEHFPTFLEDFSEAKKSGMTFPQAFLSISKTEYGSLSNEIKVSAAQLTWHLPFPKVMSMLSKRLGGSRLMKQAFTIINEAYNSGGDVAETMSSLAINVSKIKQIEDERRGIMSQQVFVMYFIFFLFIGILAGLYGVLIPMSSMNSIAGMPTDSTAAMPIKGFTGFGQPTNYCGSLPWMCTLGESLGFAEKGIYFKTLFFLMAIIQAISSGIICGQIGEGSMSAGVRHVGIMLFMTVVAFLIFFS